VKKIATSALNRFLKDVHYFWEIFVFTCEVDAMSSI